MKLYGQQRELIDDQEDSGEVSNAGDTVVDVQALELLAAHYARQDQYSLALECYFECIRLQENGTDPTTVGITWMGIGRIYEEMGNLERALECYRECGEKFKAGDNYYFEVKAILHVTNILRMKGEYETALTALLRCLMVFEELGEHSGILESLALIGNVYGQMGNGAGALSYTQRALAMLEPGDDPLLHGTLLLSLGNIYRADGYPDEALSAIESGFDIVRKIEHRGLSVRLHEAASLIYEQLGNPLLALRHNRHFVKLDREERKGRQLAGVTELQTQFEIDRVRRERDIYRRQTQELRQEVYAKTREITSMSLSLVHKGQFLEEVKRQLAQISGSPQESTTRIIKPLLADLTATIRADSGWESFQQQYNGIHHDVIHTLAERFPKLTPTELKICALTRINLSTKEIASILFVTVRNVQNHRYRIRKKLFLDPEANLVSFLKGI